MIKNKRHIVLFSLFLLLGVTSLFAGSLNNARVGVFADSEGDISELDALLLNGAVKDKIETNLKKYTEITIVSTNIPELKTIQKSTQETGIDKNTAVRMGKLMAADSMMNAVVRKGSSGYAVSIKVIDLTTGEILASVQESTKDSDSIWTGNGCAIDLLTIDFCEAVGIDLSAAEKYLLRYGEKDLSADDQLKMYQADCERYQKMIEEYNKELSLLDYSTDLDAKERQIAIEAQREIAEQKLASSLAAQQRMEELQKIRLEEEKKEAERTEEQKKKRQEIEAQTQKKVEALRNEKRKNNTVLEEIACIENEKRTYLEIRDSVNSRIDEIEEEKEAELAKAKEEIENRPYRLAHLDSEGNPIPEAKELRREEYAEKAAEIRAAKSSEIDAVKKSVSSNMAELLSTIESDNARLAKTKRKASSATEEISVVMGLYDGNKRSWSSHVYYTVDGRDLFSQEIELSYEKVTGKKITSIMDSDYLDTVDLYDSLFTRGTQVIIYELEYTVEAMPKDRPSMYKFNFETLSLKDTRQNLKVVEKQSLDRYKILHVSPQYDIRSEDEVVATEKTEQKKQSKTQKKNQTKTQNKEQKKTNTTNILSSCRREAFNCDFEYAVSDKIKDFGLALGYDYPVFGPVFIGCKLGFYAPVSDFIRDDHQETTDYDTGMLFLASAGLNFACLNNNLDVYGRISAGGGLNYMKQNDWLWSVAVGCEVSVIQIEYSYDRFRSGRDVTRLLIGFSSRTIQ